MLNTSIIIKIDVNRGSEIYVHSS